MPSERNSMLSTMDSDPFLASTSLTSSSPTRAAAAAMSTKLDHMQLCSDSPPHSHPPSSSRKMDTSMDHDSSSSSSPDYPTVRNSVNRQSASQHASGRDAKVARTDIFGRRSALGDSGNFEHPISSTSTSSIASLASLPEHSTDSSPAADLTHGHGNQDAVLYKNTLRASQQKQQQQNHQASVKLPSSPTPAGNAESSHALNSSIGSASGFSLGFKRGLKRLSRVTGSNSASVTETKPVPKLNLAGIKGYSAWQSNGGPINPPTPLQHPPTPLSHPRDLSPVFLSSLSGSGSTRVATPSSASPSPAGISPFGLTADSKTLSRPAAQAMISAVTGTKVHPRGEGSKDRPSPFALPPHQPQQYMIYDLESTPRPDAPAASAIPRIVTDASSLAQLEAALAVTDKNNGPKRITCEAPSASKKPSIAANNPAPKSTKPASTPSTKAAEIANDKLTASAKYFLKHTLLDTFVDQYDMLDELGSGGFGFVVRARRKRDGLIVAVKFIFKDRMPSQNWVSISEWSKLPDGTPNPAKVLIPLEAYVLRMVRHRGVVAFLDLLEDDSVFYLVMEHHGTPWLQSEEPGMTNTVSSGASSSIATPPPFDVETGPPSAASSLGPITPVSPFGSMYLDSVSSKLAPPRPPPMLRRSSCDLFECIEQNARFTEDQARYVFGQIVEVVYYLNSAGICHRDIKDENIVVDKEFRVKLIDFGSAIMFDRRKEPPYHQRFYGTVNFAAAEILQGQPYRAPHAEVWSLGVLMSVLLTGESPFPTQEDAARGHIHRLKANLSDTAMDLLFGCLRVDPDERLTIGEVRNHPWLRSLRVARTP